MKKIALLAILVFISIPRVFAEPYDWEPDYFLGEWEIELLFEVTDSVTGSDGPADFTVFNMLKVAFSHDGKAIVTESDGAESEVSWSSDGFVLTLAYPWDGAFQYVANYQHVAIDFDTIIITLYDIFQNPRVGVMRRKVAE